MDTKRVFIKGGLRRKQPPSNKKTDRKKFYTVTFTLEERCSPDYR